MQVAKLSTATAGRYLKFVANSEINGNAWTSAAEIGIEAAGDITGIEPVAMPSKDSKGYYDLQGRLYSADYQSLPRGIYINNGRKIMK
jgi:beta-galactosidase